MRTAFASFVMLGAVACAAESAPTPGDAIECALGQGAEFEAVCTMERASEDGAQQIILHHPDGGFRRLIVLPDGKGVAPADGAGALAQNLAGNRLEVSIDGDRYRLPARPMETATGE